MLLINSSYVNFNLYILMVKERLQIKTNEIKKENKKVKKMNIKRMSLLTR